MPRRIVVEEERKAKVKAMFGGACVSGNKPCHLMRKCEVSLDRRNPSDLDLAVIKIICVPTKGKQINPVKVGNPSHCYKLQRYKRQKRSERKSS